MMEKPLEILQTEIRIGLEKPVRFLHITDCHISHADETDRVEDPEKPAHAEGRKRAFDGGIPDSTEQYYLASLAYAKEHDLPVVCTGDLVDFLSHANFAYLEETLGKTDYFYAAGNHDFCHFVGRAKEDYAYKWEKIKVTQPHIRNNLIFSSRVIGGVNFVAVDDSYYLFTKGQEEMLRAEAAKGLPILLFLHVPLYTPLQGADQRSKNPCCYLTGAPEEMLRGFSPERRSQQTPDDATLAMIDYINHEPCIRAVIAGHTHENWEEPIASGIMQYVTDGTYHGYAREFTVF